MTFGEKLQTLRTRAGLSQDALAEALDCLLYTSPSPRDCS